MGVYNPHEFLYPEGYLTPAEAEMRRRELRKLYCWTGFELRRKEGV